MGTTPPRIRGFEDGTYLLEFDELVSTQTEARRRRQAGDAQLIGVRADYQTRGRGRPGMTWYGPRGQSLLITYLVPFDTSQTNLSGLLSMAGGLAVANAIRNLTGLQPQLRWPNDVLLSERKVAGVLIEMFPVRPEGRPALMVAALGIGLNVNVGEWPAALRLTATSLRIRTGRHWPVELVEAAVRTSLRPRLGVLAGAEPQEIVEQWRGLDASIGQNYMLTEGTQTDVVRAVAINDAGYLVIRTGTGRQFPVVSARHAVES